MLGAALLACTDAPSTPVLAPTTPSFASEGRGDFHRYVAIGTSLSMGYHMDIPLPPMPAGSTLLADR